MWFRFFSTCLLASLFIKVAIRRGTVSAWTTTCSSHNRLRTPLAAITPSRKLPLRQPIRRSNLRQQETDQRRRDAQAAYETALQDPDLLTNHTFASLGLPPTILRALNEDMGLQFCTAIQYHVWEHAVKNQSRGTLAGRAKTGSGKTLAFLLATIDTQMHRTTAGQQLPLLILAPTRELVTQISTVASQLYAHYHTNDTGGRASVRIQTLHGGHKKGRALLQRLQRRPTILVATPGRLYELASEHRFVKDWIRTTGTLVVDEADRVLPERDMQQLWRYLPSRSKRRQTLVFSATLSHRFLQQAHAAQWVGGEDYTLVDGSSANVIDGSSDLEQKRQRVEQYHWAMEDMRDYLDTFWSILDQEKNGKIIIFFPTTKLVKFMHEAVRQSRRKTPSTWSIHSRMGQGARSRANEAFRSATMGVLLSSDVSARGVDYPDVDLVVQVRVVFNWLDTCHLTFTRRRHFYLCT